MGKAEIIDEIGSGAYTIKIIYAGRDRVNGWISDLTSKISYLEGEIAGMPEGIDKTIAELTLASYENRKTYYQIKMPADFETEVYRVDRTEGLTGDVGTIEVPGERVDVNIQAGHDDNAVYDATRDGQLLPNIATSPEASYFNRALLPGWQKWKPTYRYGTIVPGSINDEANTCSLCLDPAYSSQQALVINQDNDFSPCETAGPGGFWAFCQGWYGGDADHPMCTNTEEPGPFFVDDDLYEIIKSINTQVNESHDYQTDASKYEMGEVWSILGEGETGDCEDIALTKIQALLDAGMDIKNLQLMTAYTETNKFHAVLSIQTTNRGTLILDNRNEQILEKDKIAYRWRHYQKAGSSWGVYSTFLENVPIEYMSCNSTAFSDSDRVVIKFEAQDWDNPRVIGFQQEPKTCFEVFFGFLGGNNYYDEWWMARRYNDTIESWNFLNAPDNFECYARRDIAGNSNRIYAWITGGYMYNCDYWRSYHPSIDPWGLYRVVNECQRYTKLQGEYIFRTSMPGVTYRTSHDGFILDGINYFCGGQTNIGNPLYHYVTGMVTSYNDNADSWSNKNSITRRNAHSSFIANGKGHLVGGTSDWQYDWTEGDTSGWFGDVLQYDVSGDSWSSISELPDARINHACFKIDDKGYMFGGWSKHDYGGEGYIEADFEGQTYKAYYANTLFEFDEPSRTWTQKTSARGDGIDELVNQPMVGSGNSGFMTSIEFSHTNHPVRRWNKETNAWTDRSNAYNQTRLTDGAMMVA